MNNAPLRTATVARFAQKSPIYSASDFPFAYLIVCFCLLVGCRPIETRFNVVAYKQPEQRERFSERFETGAFIINAKKNYEFAFELAPTLVEVPVTPPNEPAPQNPSEDRVAKIEQPLADEVWMSQIIHIEVFWRPEPGRTYAEKTQTNATILYTLLTGNDAISYEGTGFVYFRPSWDKRTITGHIESATLFPARQVGAPSDLFGPCHLTGAFRAVQNDVALVRAEQKIRRILGPPLTASTNKPTTN